MSVFIVFATVVILMMKSPVPMCSRLLPTFSSMSFNVTGFMLTLNNLGLKFIQDYIHGFIYIVLHAFIHSYQHYLWTMLFFLHCIFFGFFFKIQIFIGVWIKVSVIKSIAFVHICFYVNTKLFLIAKAL